MWPFRHSVSQVVICFVPHQERLNGENGLLLTPTVDHLFDRGFISFEDSGVLIVSPVAHVPSLNRMGSDCGDHDACRCH